VQLENSISEQNFAFSFKELRILPISKLLKKELEAKSAKEYNKTVERR
jgi:hypothetical protein